MTAPQPAPVSAPEDLPRAVVVGLDTMQGLQTARILARHGVPVIGIASDGKHPACRTNVCERVVVAEDRDRLMAALETIGEELAAKAVLVPCLDGKVLTVSRAREHLEQWYRIVLPSPDTVEMLMDKAEFYRYALANGFPIPPTHLLDPQSDIAEIAAGMDYPCVLKPAYRTSRWTANTSAKAFKIDTANELVARFAECSRWTDDLILQRWIAGGVSDLYSCNCYFGVDGEPLATFVARKLRQWPPDTGQSSLGEECRDDVVLEETIKLLSSVEYRGLGYVEMKRDAGSGQYYIVEPNIGRPTGRSAIAEAGGVELLYTMYCDAVGLPLPARRNQVYTDVKWIHLRRDLQSAWVARRRGELTIRDWWRSVRGKKAYALFSLSDPMPFFLDIISAGRSAVSRLRSRS